MTSRIIHRRKRTGPRSTGSRLIRTALIPALLTGLLGALCGAASSQDDGASVTKDEIFARKIVMDEIDRRMMELDWMMSSGKPLDMHEAIEHADTISVLLLAFPHLFSPDTNQWRPDAKRDPARDTYASPDLWTKFPDFYRQATAASRTAFEASRAKREADFRNHIEALRAACEGCHAAYLKVDP